MCFLCEIVRRNTALRFTFSVWRSLQAVIALKLTVLCSDKDHVLVFRAKADEWKYRKMKNLHQFTDGREKEKDSTNSWLIVVTK